MKNAWPDTILDVKILWDVLQDVLLPAWPSDRTTISGTALGDAWPLSTLQSSPSKGNVLDPSTIQPFHKLTQWLTYSLMVPFEHQLGYNWKNKTLLTGLPEYHNGGPFIDMEVLTLKPPVVSIPIFEPGDDVIVEWRAMSVALLDELYKMFLRRMQKKDCVIQLSMAQVLESGTWKAGRETAAKKRPISKSSPILTKSDGMVF